MTERKCNLCNRTWPCLKSDCSFHTSVTIPEPIHTGGTDTEIGKGTGSGSGGWGVVAALGVVGIIYGTGSFSPGYNNGEYGNDGFVYTVLDDAELYDINKQRIGTLSEGSCVIAQGVGIPGSILEGYRYLEVRTPMRFNGAVHGTMLKFQPEKGTENCSASLSSRDMSIYKVFNDSILYYGTNADGSLDNSYLAGGSCVMVDDSRISESGRIPVFLHEPEEVTRPTYAETFYIDAQNVRAMGVFDLDCLGYAFGWSVEATERTMGTPPQPAYAAPKP